MIIVYDGNNVVVNVIWDKDRFIAPTTNTLIVDETDLNKATLLELFRLTTANDRSLYTVVNGQLLRNGSPVTLDVDTFKDNIRTAYTTMITRLDQIQNTTNPTNAQVIAAIKDMALYEEHILQALKELFT